ncbi:MAG: hypothetical protein LBL71_02145 [Endomicrobium sp.]|jgi:hypothetical protein|nr:hypothetical protein [Endomicrobium sp.]
MKKITVYMLVLGLAVPVNAGWKFWKKNPSPSVIVVENPTYLKVITICFILMVIVYIPFVYFFIQNCRANSEWKTADTMLHMRNTAAKK